jgi:hypothetical protein
MNPYWIKDDFGTILMAIVPVDGGYWEAWYIGGYWGLRCVGDRFQPAIQDIPLTYRHQSSGN